MKSVLLLVGVLIALWVLAPNAHMRGVPTSLTDRIWQTQSGAPAGNTQVSDVGFEPTARPADPNSGPPCAGIPHLTIDPTSQQPIARYENGDAYAIAEVPCPTPQRASLSSDQCEGLPQPDADNCYDALADYGAEFNARSQRDPGEYADATLGEIDPDEGDRWDGLLRGR